MTFRNSDFLDNAEINVNGESRRKDNSEVSEAFDEMEKVNTKEEASVGLTVSDSTMAALQQEVEQLTTALATQSKVVCDGHISYIVLVFSYYIHVGILKFKFYP